MDETGPARRYYESLTDAWSGRFTITVTDWRGGGRGAGAAKAMAAAMRVVGPALMETTLATDGADFVHTTRVSKWGVTLLETRERIVLAGDGRSLAMTGEQRARFGASEPYEAEGEIDEGATGATYRIPWAGVELVQRTRIVDGGAGLELAQETPFSRAFVLLRRAS